MKGKALSSYLAFFIISAGLIGAFILSLRRTPQFTISSHAFWPFSPAFFILTPPIFLLLAAFWVFYAKAAARLFQKKLGEILAEDFLTFIPLLFLSLMPLTLGHYISSGDLEIRLKLLAASIMAAVLYLKVAQMRRWNKEKPSLRPRPSERFFSRPLRQKIILLFLASLLIFSAAVLLFIQGDVTAAGDEPHYLLITHSLIRDGDLDLANNYAQQDYSRYLASQGKMQPHAVWGTKPGTLYSSHSPGVAVLLLPFYALGSFFKGKALLFFIRLGIGVFGALLTVQIFLYARSEWESEKLALRLWLLTSFTSPVLFYSFHVYPEIVIALLAFVVFRLFRFSSSLSWPKIIVGGLFLSSFIWFHSLKYIALFIPLFFYGLWAAARKFKSPWKAGLFAAIPAVTTLLYLNFQHVLYGSYSLSSVSWARPMSGEESLSFAKDLLFGIPFRYRWETLVGYFYDQRDGLLFYAPIYFFALLGAWEMWKSKRRDLFLLFFITAPYVLLSAFLTQRTGYAPQARPLVAVIWGIIILLGHFLARNQKRLFAYLFNFAVAVSFVSAILLLKFPLNLYQETTRGATERGGGLFYLLSNIRFRLTDYLPSYIKVEEWRWLPNFIWLGVTALFLIAYIALKKRPAALKSRAHVLLACLGVVVFFFWIVLYPRKVLLNPIRFAFPSAEKVTFYSVSRSARMAEPGKFQLREDGRDYRFSFATRKPIQELRLSFGSTSGDYGVEMKIFDLPIFRGQTREEIKQANIARPPRYKLKKESYYELTLTLGKDPNIQTELYPYLLIFNITYAPD